MIDIVAIGKIIQKLRNDKNLTQEELAEKINLSPHYLSKVERGLSKLNVEAFLKMAEVLSFTLEDFGINSKYSNNYQQQESQNSKNSSTKRPAFLGYKKCSKDLS